jgi:hypothetical protein
MWGKIFGQAGKPNKLIEGLAEIAKSQDIIFGNIAHELILDLAARSRLN